VSEVVEMELVACFCANCYRWFYTERDDVGYCPHCGSRRVCVDYDVAVTAVERIQTRITG